MNYNYTTIEQSKKLVELGLNPDTADMFYSRRPNGKSEYSVLPDFKPEGRLEVFTKVDLPCWSLGALLELMPKELEDDLDLCYGTFDGNGEYQALWTCSCMNHVNFGETSIDAAFKVVCWLLENKKL